MSLKSLVIIVIFFLVSVDQLSKSVWNSFLKCHSRAVMLLDSVLNNQGTRPNPQDQCSATINKLSFGGNFPKKFCYFQGEYSSATPLFSIDRLTAGCLAYSCFSHIYVCTYVLTAPSKKFGIQDFFATRSFLLCAHTIDFLNSSLAIASLYVDCTYMHS